jgi:predicted enzyme related to lactoylglutathione lyase
MIDSVVGITLWTDDLDRLYRFYHDLLRLPLHANRGDFISFRMGESMRFNIGSHEGVSGVSRDPFRMMPHLGVVDIHEEHRRLAEAGVEFLRPPEQEHWGGWVATFKDPDGNILQMLQPPN